MRIYAAAVYSNTYARGGSRFVKLNEPEVKVVDNLENILESYHYVKKQAYVDTMRNNNAKIFLDSGAFSAFTLNVKITVDEYVEYIHKNKDIIKVDDGILVASVLDGIGNALETYQNQKIMEKKGVKPLPCFHAGEDERYLEYYIKNYEYITLGGLVGSSTAKLTEWLDRVWSKYLLNGSGRARLKVHGFGITSIPLMERYPWYSCDSSSWIQAAAFGKVIVKVNDKFYLIAVSEKSPFRHDKGQHFCNMTEIEVEKLNEIINNDNFLYDRLSTVYESRACYNLLGFAKMNEHFANKNSTNVYFRQELF